MNRLKSHLRSKILAVALLATLFSAPVLTSVKLHAQEPDQHQGAGAPPTPGTAETPKSEESQEEAFLNSPVVQKIAQILHVRETTARDALLIINFAIIFFAIVIPLGRMMPKIFRKRAQTLSFQLDEARKASEEARKRMSAVEAKLAGLDQEIAAFRAQVEQESLQDEKRIKASLKEESERIVAAAEQEIDVAAQHARRTLQSFAADLAIDRATKQLKLTPDTDRELISEFIQQLSSADGNAAVAAKRGNK